MFFTMKAIGFGVPYDPRNNLPKGHKNQLWLIADGNSRLTAWLYTNFIGIEFLIVQLNARG